MVSAHTVPTVKVCVECEGAWFAAHTLEHAVRCWLAGGEASLRSMGGGWRLCLEDNRIVLTKLGGDLVYTESLTGTEASEILAVCAKAIGEGA